MEKEKWQKLFDLVNGEGEKYDNYSDHLDPRFFDQLASDLKQRSHLEENSLIPITDEEWDVVEAKGGGQLGFLADKINKIVFGLQKKIWNSERKKLPLWQMDSDPLFESERIVPDTELLIVMARIKKIILDIGSPAPVNQSDLACLEATITRLYERITAVSNKPKI